MIRCPETSPKALESIKEGIEVLDKLSTKIN
jgi:hypothetical protein